ncbi:MAG: hypothetical protein ACE5HU_08500 [Acidobacteriota bacterium]
MDDRASGTFLASRAAVARRSAAGAIVEDGVLAGAVGAAVVALWFLVLDVVHGAAFFTPSLLGSVLFQGRSPEDITSVDPAMVFAYTGLHGLLFIGAGLVITWMFSQFERNPQFGMVLLLLFLLFEAIVMGLEFSIMPRLVGALGTWAVGLANLLAAVAMFWFLLRRRPEAFAKLRKGWNE